MTSATRITLREMLDTNLRAYPPEYRDGLTNHLPMALHALSELGASAVRMRKFETVYGRHFDGQTGPPPAAEPASDWLALRGRPDAYPALLAGFQQALARDGSVEVLRQALPALLSGVGAAAFHGAIRTAHAVQAGHRGELAAALAYWAWRWFPLAPAAVDQPLMRFDDWSARLLHEARDWQPAAQARISGRMRLATEFDTYRTLGAALAPEPDTLQRLAALAVERYCASRNFTVLHMVTGLRAVRVLLPFAGDVLVHRDLVQGFVAAYLAAQVKVMPTAGPDGRSWDEVIAAAIAQDDDHVIKLVHACREEAAVYGEGRYLEAAALAVSTPRV